LIRDTMQSACTAGDTDINRKGRLLFSANPTITFPARKHHCTLATTKLILLMWTTCWEPLSVGLIAKNSNSWLWVRVWHPNHHTSQPHWSVYPYYVSCLSPLVLFARLYYKVILSRNCWVTILSWLGWYEYIDHETLRLTSTGNLIAVCTW